MKFNLLIIGALTSMPLFGQNPLPIPPAITASTVTLTLDESTHQFYPGITTNTMGANGPILGPTLILNQGDNVTLNVNNQLMDTTTIHWHGLHVAPENDGGPHSIIYPGQTWSPSFTVLDKAGTYWYHPHLHMQTDKHVSKGIAGMILVRDAEEATLNLPISYGVDEFPLVLQTKGFDANGQILVHTDLDTSVMVNGMVNATLDVPAQVIRLRVLNGASQRVMEIGFSDNRSFSLIGTDGGLLTAPVTMNRYRIAPGQRADILIDLGTSLGQNFQLMSFASELPNAIYGAAQPGMGAGSTGSLPDYTNNPLNGNDYQLLDISVVAQTGSPITSIPVSLANFTTIPETSANTTRTLTFTSAGAMGDLGGPFLINNTSFNMNTINYTIPLNNIEIWEFTNSTPIAHPFHIHDVQFFILDINGTPPPPALQGYNDVILIPGGMGTARFIAHFTNHTNDSIPFMYHCHMLTHEDMGMMGQFLVVDPNAGIEEINAISWSVYPNPSTGVVTIKTEELKTISLFDLSGRKLNSHMVNGELEVAIEGEAGIYILKDIQGEFVRIVID